MPLISVTPPLDRIQRGATKLIATSGIITLSGGKLAVVGTAGALFTPTSLIHLQAESGDAAEVFDADRVAGQCVFRLTSYHTTPVPQFFGRSARGNRAAPTASQSGDVLFRLSGSGYGATGFNTARGRLNIKAAQAWSDTAQGTRFTFDTTPLGTTAIAEVASIEDEGRFIAMGIGLNGAAAATGMVNGSFGIWQRGNGAFTADAAWTADCWRIDLNGTSTISVTMDTANTVGVYSARCAAVVYTHNTASRLFNKYRDWSQIRTKTVTFSVYVKSSVASAVRLQIDDGIGVTSGSYHTGGGTYERLTVTRTIDTNATTCEFAISFEATGTHYCDNAQWVFGTHPGDYWSADPSVEKTRCQVFYQVLKISAAGVAAAADADITVPIPIQNFMVDTPTIKELVAGTKTNMKANYPQLNGVNAATGTTLTDAEGAYMTIRSNAAGAFSVIDEEIYLEANP